MLATHTAVGTSRRDVETVRYSLQKCGFCVNVDTVDRSKAFNVPGPLPLPPSTCDVNALFSRDMVCIISIAVLSSNTFIKFRLDLNQSN